MKSIEYYICKICEFALLIVSLLVLLGGILGGFGLIIFQIFNYLKVGIWEPYSLLNAISKINEKSQHWVESPTDWVGLHSIFSRIPLSLCSVLVGLLLGMYLFKSLEEFKKENHALYKS